MKKRSLYGLKKIEKGQEYWYTPFGWADEIVDIGKYPKKEAEKIIKECQYYNPDCDFEIID